MSFETRREVHDRVLAHDLPLSFIELGIDFRMQGYETTIAKDDMVITRLEDSTALSIRFRPDGVAIISASSYLTELKTLLPEQTSANYDFEMTPWEKGMASHLQGNLVAYIFWPAMKTCWISDTKPDWIGVPRWRWNEQDWLRVKHKYDYLCPVYHTDTEKGSGTIFGLIHWDRIKAMASFNQFWQEVQGKWQSPKQLKLILR